MSVNDSKRQDCIEIEKRTRRALEECMSVLPEFGRAADAPGLFVVVGENENGEYLCDTQTGSCECKDAEYRDPDGGCKHVRRARIATGESAVPAGALGGIDIDSTLGVHVDASARFATADGGIIEPGDGAELVDNNEQPRFLGPFSEYNKYGEPTGAQYLRCSGCGVEVLTGHQENAVHGPDCSGC